MTQKKIDAFRENGLLIGEIRQKLVDFAQTNHQLEDIEAHAVALIKKAGGEPAFMRVPEYKWATCISVNSQIVHGIPKGKIKPGDLVTIDTGMYYCGTTTDCATTFVLNSSSPELNKFMNTGKKALSKAISSASVGSSIKKISKAMQQTVEKAGCNVSRTLTGHGLGSTMHEDPPIPCFTSLDPALNVKLTPGMVLAIEIMYMQGQWPLTLDSDGWTLSTKDGSLSAVYEENVIITPRGPDIITLPHQLVPEEKV